MRLNVKQYRVQLAQERMLLGLIRFDENQHPRDFRGRFRGKGVGRLLPYRKAAEGRQTRHLTDLAEDAVAHANEVARVSPWHGEPHWKDVARYAVAFAEENGGDPVVAFLFGAFHDTKRQNDYEDPEHGPRAADMVESRAETDLAFLSDEQIEKLTFALDYHDAGQTTDDPTIGACWDADRVTLWRVGIQPAGRFMSTPRAKQNPGLAETDIMKDDLTWAEIAAGVDASVLHAD